MPASLEQDGKRNRDLNLATLLAVALGVAAFAWFLRTGQLLLYGDAVAHLNIARRVVDSRTPGLRQLGTVWLPLPHLLMLPLVRSDALWRSGVAGSVFSIIGYVLAARGIFRLAWSIAGRGAAWLVWGIFVANPNLIYLQATAMTESIYLAAFVWAVVWFSEFARSVVHGEVASAVEPGRELLYGSFALMAAMLTRYDGWFLSAACWGVVLLIAVLRRQELAASLSLRSLKRVAAQGLLLTALVPAGWLAYNYSVFHNALEFANGPYSAKGVAERTTRRGAPPHPGYHSMPVAVHYFTKAARLNMGEGRWPEWIFAISVLGSLLLAVAGEWPAMLMLCSVLPFYALSISYGGVPIFIPPWWPFSYYNVRYGIQLLPLFALALGVLPFTVTEFTGSRKARTVALAVIGGLAALSYGSAWRATPISLREARVNSAPRVIYEHRLAEVLQRLPAGSSILMYSSAHVGALQMAGVHLRRTINEGNYYEWKAALDDPQHAADYVVATTGDPIAEAMQKHPAEMTVIATVEGEGQPPTYVYRSSR